MPPAQKNDEQLLDDVLEADDDPAYLLQEILIVLVQKLDRFEFVCLEFRWL